MHGSYSLLQHYRMDFRMQWDCRCSGGGVFRVSDVMLEVQRGGWVGAMVGVLLSCLRDLSNSKRPEMLRVEAATEKRSWSIHSNQGG